MNRKQAMTFLPDLFRKMGTGMSIDIVASATAFIDWLYTHHFLILSRKERVKLTDKIETLAILGKDE